MKDEIQVKEEIILVVKEVIADNTSARDIDDIAELDSNDVDHIAEAVADRLYADGYGDVAEWKKRAEVAERALEYAVSEYRCDECPCIECNAEIRGSLECIDLIAKTYKEEAEREIEEEENNGKK